MVIRPFGFDGKWYKGNIHCHTTRSDGMLSPDELARVYREKGYSFFAVTDHGIPCSAKDLDQEGFLVLPGIEVDISSGKNEKTYHFLGLNHEESGPGRENEQTPDYGACAGAQQILDMLAAQGQKAVLCHPVWSRLELADFIDLKGFFAVEIYNHTADCFGHIGNSEVYWDSLLRRGKKVWGVATDDSHQFDYAPNDPGAPDNVCLREYTHRAPDIGFGWVVAKSASFSKASIWNALLNGIFYSSQGPAIYDFYVADGYATVTCSPVKAIHFVTWESHGCTLAAKEGQFFESGSFPLKGGEKFIRVVCIDEHGKCAWTNPIFMDDAWAGVPARMV
jgi:hypothetical protein